MLNSIQILRALAALFVVFAHFEYINPAVGAFGVDLFFIISGFIMSYIVEKNTTAFLYRRIIRIVPLYYFMTLLTTGLFLAKPSWFRNVIFTPEALAKSLLFIPYRIKGSGPILSLGWTLNYEMFFYMAIAISIALLPAKRAMIACLVALTVFVGISSIYPSGNYVVHFWGGTVVLEFVFGGILYYLWKNKIQNVGRSMRKALLAVGLASFLFLIYADYVADPRATRFLVFGIPSFFIALAFLVIERSIDRKNKIHAAMILLGDSSYAMYLVHPFVIYGFLRLVFNRVSPEGELFEFIGLVLAMVTVCLVSIALHKWFEKPVIAWLKSMLDKRFDPPKSLESKAAM